MSSSTQCVLREPETTRFPRTAPAYCAVVAVTVLMLSGLSVAAAAKPHPDATGSDSNLSEQSTARWPLSPDQPASPDEPMAPQPEAAPSASFTPIDADPSITPAAATPDTGAVGHGGGGVFELALAATDGGQDAVWRAHAHGVLTIEHDAPTASAGFNPVLLLPLGAGLAVLGAVLVVAGFRSRGDDFDEPEPAHPSPPAE
jgi:hypothetical protein